MSVKKPSYKKKSAYGYVPARKVKVYKPSYKPVKEKKYKKIKIKIKVKKPKYSKYSKYKISSISTSDLYGRGYGGSQYGSSRGYGGSGSYGGYGSSSRPNEVCKPAVYNRDYRVYTPGGSYNYQYKRYLAGYCSAASKNRAVSRSSRIKTRVVIPRVRYDRDEREFCDRDTECRSYCCQKGYQTPRGGRSRDRVRARFCEKDYRCRGG